MQSFLIVKFQRNGSKVLEKDILDCKTGKRLEEDLHLKGTENKITTANFSKCMLYKGRSQGITARKNSL